MRPLALAANSGASVANVLELLKAVFPPRAVVHVGAGAGRGDVHLWRQWGIANATLIDADEDRLAWALDECAGQHGWQALAVTLAGCASEVAYFRASNPDEDGLVSPEHLNALWPNLRQTSTSTRYARTLDGVLAEAGTQAEGGWLIIDCLPAREILEGGGQALKHATLVCARVAAIPATAQTGANSPILDYTSLSNYLAPMGFVPVARIEGNHPALAYAFFTSDLNAQIARLQNENGEKDALLKGKATLEIRCGVLEKELASLTQARDGQGKLAADRLTQIDTLTQDYTALSAEKELLLKENATCDVRRGGLEKELAELTLARDEQSKLAADRLAKIDTLTQGHAALSSEKDALLKEKATLETRRGVLEKEMAALIQARDEQSKLAADRQAQIGTLTQGHTALSGEKDALLKDKATLEARRGGLEKELVALAEARDAQVTLGADRQTQIDTLTQGHTALSGEKDALLKDKATCEARRGVLEKELAALTQARVEQEALAADRQAQIGTLTQGHTALSGEKDALLKDNATLEARREALEKELATRTQARDEQGKVAADRQARIDAIVKEKTEITTARDEQTKLASERKTQLDKITVERDQAKKSASDLKANLESTQLQNQQLEADAAENQHRQQLMHEELLKGEAQIELIKDLLLREPGL